MLKKTLGALFILLSLTCLGAPGLMAQQRDVPAAVDASTISPTQHGPLSAAQRAAFFGATPDPAAMDLLGVNEDYAGRSYLAGDEWNLHLIHDQIKDAGGVYVGVGADQGYILLSWSKAKYAYLIDYDARVVLTHKIYRSFLLRSETPREFVSLWEKKNAEKAMAIIAQDWKDDKDLGEIEKVYKEWRRKILHRHLRINKSAKESGVAVYSSDQKLYDYVRGMVATDRVRAMSGNLLDKQALVSIGETAAKLSEPVGLLYLSNAQEYWKYPEQFRANIAALPFSERSKVLHTLSTWSTNKDYRYVVQGGPNYQSWIASAWVSKVYYMVPRRKLEGAEDIDVILFDGDVEEAKARHDRRRKKKKK